ncbi:uncharacterized protein (UPF0335 family) [Bradyrhizobium sp. USDA 4504]
MSDITIPGGKIRSFIERIENLDAELQELNEQKKEVFSEAKGEGFDVKILKEIVKLRKQDQDERDERESLLDLYMRAMETAPADKAAAESGVRRPLRSPRSTLRGRAISRRTNFPSSSAPVPSTIRAALVAPSAQDCVFRSDRSSARSGLMRRCAAERWNRQSKAIATLWRPAPFRPWFGR